MYGSQRIKFFKSSSIYNLWWDVGTVFSLVSIGLYLNTYYSEVIQSFNFSQFFDPKMRERVWGLAALCLLSLAFVMRRFIVVNCQNKSYRLMKNVLEVSPIAASNGVVSDTTIGSAKLPPLHAFPDQSCVSTEVEGYLDIPDDMEATEFGKRFADEFYRHIFASQVTDISVVNLSDDIGLHFAKWYKYNIQSTLWEGYIFHWMNLHTTGRKIAWRLETAMLDKYGWNPGEKKKGESDGFREFFLKHLAEAYQAVAIKSLSATADAGVREAGSGRRVAHDEEQ